MYQGNLKVVWCIANFAELIKPLNLHIFLNMIYLDNSKLKKVLNVSLKSIYSVQNIFK